MRRQAAIIGEVISDFLRDKADGPAQLDIGQSFLAQVEDGLEADVKELGHLMGRPQVLRRSFLQGWVVIICGRIAVHGEMVVKVQSDGLVSSGGVSARLRE